MDLWVYYGGKYCGDEFIEEWCAKISPYVKSGWIDICGEDGCHWRFSFANGAWNYENGRIVYDNDPALMLVEEYEQKLLEEIIEAVTGNPSTDGKPSVQQAADAAEAKRRLSAVLTKWNIL